jgi:hypothetical protein
MNKECLLDIRYNKDPEHLPCIAKATYVIERRNMKFNLEQAIRAQRRVRGTTTLSLGARGGAVVEVLLSKPEGRGIDSRWCHWNFSVT